MDFFFLFQSDDDLNIFWGHGEFYEVFFGDDDAAFYTVRKQRFSTILTWRPFLFAR